MARNAEQDTESKESTAPQDQESTEVSNDVDPHDPKSAENVSHDENANVADAREDAGVKGKGPLGGWVDGQTRRSGAEVMTGHFCTVDRTADGVKDELDRVKADSDRDGYGVFLEAAETDDEGYPKTAIVRLRDDTHAKITVPYKALRPAAAGGR